MSKFRDRLEESLLACHAVLWWLQRWWPSAWIHPSTSPDWIGKDEGDIIITMVGHWERVEVKNVGKSFTGWHDWPFKDAIVDCKKAFNDHEKDSPFPLAAYVFVNTERTHCGVITPCSRETWFLDDRHWNGDDGKKMPKKPFYVCPLSIRVDGKVRPMIEWRNMLEDRPRPREESA